MSDEAQRFEKDPDLARYSRQILYEHVGEKGQRRLMKSRVVCVGCGALGTVLANTLARAGVGHIRVIDRDFIEYNNLQRQVLFCEADIEEGIPKAEAAKRRLEQINSQVEIDAIVADVNFRNIELLCEGYDLLLDGADNFETRFLINDLAVATDRPWVYGACVGATGLMMPVIPNETPCLRCVFEEAPPPEFSPSCDTAGVLGPVVNMIASLQVMEALKILIGKKEHVTRKLVSYNAWETRFSKHSFQSALEKGNCPCCKQRSFDFLEGKFGSTTTTLCGRNAIQINLTDNSKVDFKAIAEKISAVASSSPKISKFMLRARIDRFELTVFSDGRAIIGGTNNPDEARSVYSKYIGA